MNKKHALAAVTLVGTLMLAGFGCGSVAQTITDKAANVAVNSAINSQTGGNANVDLQNGTVNFKDKDGNTVNYGTNATIPDNFPKAVPVYQGATVVLASTSTDGASL